MRSLSPFSLALAALLPWGIVAQNAAGLKACLTDASIPFLDPASTTWNEAIEPFNLRVTVTPLAIAIATSTEHVQDAVKCAVENKVKVTAKSGGHSYASYGLGGNDGQFVIQLDHKYDVKLRSDNVAVVWAGARLGVVASQLYEQGRRGISHGTCPSVGVGGHVTHGGFGFSSHTHGLALDWLVGAKVVLADGRLVYASETQNTDLFWALRGAGSSFGIAVEFEFKTFPLPEQITWFSISSNVTGGTKAETVKGLLAFQEVVASGGIDPKLNMRLGFGSSRQQNLEVAYHGGEADARAALQVLTEPLKLLWDSRNTLVESGDFLEHMEAWSYGDALNITYPYEGRQNAYTSSLVTKALNKASVESWVDYWFDHAMGPDAPGWWAQMDVYGDPNSAIIKVPAWATSYAHRDKLWLWQLSTVWNEVGGDTQPQIDFLQGLMDSISDPLPAGSWGRYANYIDTELDRHTALKQYYGSSLERLRGIKTTLDRDDLFHYPQSVPSWYKG